MKLRPASAALFVIVISLVACSRTSPAQDAEQVARAFNEAIASWDTAAMVNLTCPEDRSEVEAGLSLGSAFLGFGAQYGANAKGELKDVEYQTVLLSADLAEVRVSGRILYGPPLGSVDISSTGLVKREERRWCVSNEKSDQTTSGPGDDSAPKRRPARVRPTVTDDMQVAVDVVDNDFTPSSLQIKKGATITWTFKGRIPHTVTEDPGESMTPFESDTMSEGTFAHTFDSVGTFVYHCVIHHIMEGTITVTE